MEQKRGNSLVKTGGGINRLVDRRGIKNCKGFPSNSSLVMKIIGSKAVDKNKMNKKKPIESFETKKKTVGMTRNTSGKIFQQMSPTGNCQRLHSKVRATVMKTEAIASPSSKVGSPKNKVSLALFLGRKTSLGRQSSKATTPLAQSLRKITSMRDTGQIPKLKPLMGVNKIDEKSSETQKSDRNSSKKVSALFLLKGTSVNRKSKHLTKNASLIALKKTNAEKSTTPPLKVFTKKYDKNILDLVEKLKHILPISQIKPKITSIFEEFDGEFITSNGLYEIEKEIGKGCFGSVYLAKQVITGLPVALKAITKSSIVSPKATKRLTREIQILQKLIGVQHVTQLLEVFEDADHIFLVFIYEGGGDLVAYFKTHPLLGENNLKLFFIQLVNGLRGIHKSGVIHRDIKMDNVLLDHKFTPIIADFGISSILEKGKQIKDTGGTPAYLAPEVILAQGNVGYCSDIWSLGVLLFVLSFGYVPFQGGDIQELYRNIIKGDFSFPEFNYVSSELKNLLKQMMEVNIRSRITISGILRHPWLSNSETEQFSYKTDVSYDRQFKETVSRYLNDIGFPLDYIFQSISKNKYNHVTACFRNLEIYLNQSH